MNKVAMFRLVVVGLFFSFLLQVGTVIIILFRIKVPDMQLIFEIHEYNGLFLAALVFAHIMLNWGWIKVNLLKLK